MSATTTTTTASAPSSYRINPKDSMKSTWRTSPRSSWKIEHWFFEVFGLHPTNADQNIPVHQKSDPIPYLDDLAMHVWILSHAFIPILLHEAYIWYTGHNMSLLAAMGLYSVFFKVNALHELHILRRIGHKYGFLDGDKHERDGIPDVSVRKVMISLMSTATIRPVGALFIAYNYSETPLSSINWPLLALSVGLYPIALDFWFYIYHRVMHATDSFWQYHRTHHLTKHPNPLLTLYADTEQEIFDIAVIPLAAFFTLKVMGLPMNFYEWWFCQEYVVFTELFGHSGIRVYGTPPQTFSELLRFFGMELQIEDHDLHHRKGWKKSHNYGKQTRVWDKIFGTCHPRIEALPELVDKKNVAYFPLI